MWIASVLCFVAGYADLMSVVRFRVFTGMVGGGDVHKDRMECEKAPEN